MKCYTCSKRINEKDSYKIANNYTDRMCRECIREGRGGMAVKQLLHNKETEE